MVSCFFFFFPARRTPHRPGGACKNFRFRLRNGSQYRSPWPPRLRAETKELRCAIDLSVSSDHAQAMIASWSVYMLVAVLPAPFRCLWFLDARHWRRLGGLETGAKALACVLFTLLAASSGGAGMAASWNLFVCASYHRGAYSSMAFKAIL